MCLQCRRPGLNPWVRKIPWREGNGSPLQYSCLGNPMERGAWRATVHGFTESDMTERLTQLLIFFIFEIRKDKTRSSLTPQPLPHTAPPSSKLLHRSGLFLVLLAHLPQLLPACLSFCGSPCLPRLQGCPASFSAVSHPCVQHPQGIVTEASSVHLLSSPRFPPGKSVFLLSCFLFLARSQAGGQDINLGSVRHPAPNMKVRLPSVNCTDLIYTVQ